MDIAIQMHAERALIGSAIARVIGVCDAAKFFSGSVDSQWFVSPVNSRIADAIHYCTENRMTPDAQTIAMVVLSSGHDLPTIKSDIERCIEASPCESIQAVEHYSAIVRDAYVARRIRDRCVDIAAQADAFMPGGIEALELSARAICDGVTTSGRAFWGMGEIDESMANPNSVKSYIKALNNPKVTTCGGYPSGEYSFVMSPRGNGKSAVLIREAMHAAIDLGKRVVYASLEMSKEQVKARAIKQLTGWGEVPYRDDYRREYDMHRRILSESGLVLMHCVGEMTVWERFRAEICKYAKVHGIDFLVVDYIQRFRSAKYAKGGSASRTEDLDYIADDLKNLSAELAIPALTAAQPTQQMSAESAADFTTKHAKAIEEHAALGINILKSKEGHVESIISKNRYGPNYIRLPLTWDEQHAEFREH